MDTHTLETPEVDLTYDVRGPLPPTDGHPVLLMAGHPMEAGGFAALAGHLDDRTVITYDPRGVGRSERKDGREDRTPSMHAADLHALITHLGAGPVDVFASSGGAVNALELVATHPDDVRILVAHEPPVLAELPDAEWAVAAERAFMGAYQLRGSSWGMAGFMAFTSWQGEFTPDYVEQPLPDPAAFGMPVDDDGSRDDPLLSGTGAAITAYRPDYAALRAASTRVVMAAGVESRDTVTGRTAASVAAGLGEMLVMFPSHHGGFLGGELGWSGEPEAFAVRLHEVLDAPT